MSDRYCIRGCTVRDEHYAACDVDGCPGCAPREAREGVMICAGCYGRSRRLLADLDDLLGRLGSLADPMKATPTDKEPGGGGSTEPPAPIDADLIDAIRDITRTVVAWTGFTGRRTIDEAFDDIANDVEDMTRFAEGWLVRTPVDEDGIRPYWTVADAMAKWGPERRTKNDSEWVDDVSGEEVAAIPEWGDQLLNRDEADREAGSASTLRRWLQRELIAPVGTIYIAGRRTTLFRRSELMRVKAEQVTNQRAGRPRTSKEDSMTDEKLVKEAAKAIYETRDDAYDLDAWEQLDSTQQERYTCDARAALAVFEKAHTPTDDEREALANILGEPVRGTLALADRILAAGFRRSEVPEPSAIIDDGTDDAWQAIADALGNLGYDLNFHEDTAAWVQQYLFTSEPQGEPSDAQADEAQRGYHAFTFGPEEVDTFLTAERLAKGRDAWKAALRAAGGVR